MAGEKELLIKLLLDDKEALAKFNQAIEQINNKSKKSNEAAGIAWAGLASQLYIVEQAARPVLNFMRQSITAAVEQEDAIRRLNFALQGQGTYTEQLSRQLEEMAKQFQESTRFSDEAVQRAMQTLVTFGNVAPSQLQRVTRAALDYSTQSGKALDESATLLAKAAAGNFTQLKRLGLVFQESASNAEKFEKALQFIEKRMGGASKKDLDSFGGAIAHLGNMFSELQESVGKFIVDTPEFTDAIKQLNIYLKEFQKYLADTETQKGFRMFLIEAQKDTITWTIGMVYLDMQAHRLVETMQRLSPLATVMRGFGPVDNSGSEELANILEELYKKTTALQAAQDALKNSSGSTSPSPGSLSEPISDTGMTPNASKYQLDAQAFIDSEATKIQALRSMWGYWQNEKIANAMTEQANETALLNLYLDIQKQAHQSMWTAVGKMKDTFQSGIADMFKQMIRGNLDAGAAFKELGLKMVDVLIDYGTQLAVNAVLSKLFTAQQLGVSIAAAQATALAWAAAAANVSLASFGSNAAGAAAGITSTHALAAALSVVPGLEEGGDIWRAGRVLVGERGPELLDLPAGAKVTPLNDSHQENTYQITVHIHNPVFAPGDLSDQLIRELGPKLSDFIYREKERL